MSSIVRDFFTKQAKQIAQEVGFVQRKSKLKPRLFAEVLLSSCLSETSPTLEQMCGLLQNKGVSITKQGLHERFNHESVEWMKRLFGVSLQQFKTQQCECIDLLKCFSDVKIQDSSTISLNPFLKGLYPGCGGDASEAALKLQTLWNYTHCQIEALTITSGCENDQSFTGHLNAIKPGALYLQDLGYFKIASLGKIIDSGGYFISRYLPWTTLLDEQGHAIDLLKQLSKSDGFLAQEVWVNRPQKPAIRLRLIAERLPPQEAEIRLRKLKEGYRRRGLQPSHKIKKLANWSLYLTNVRLDWLSDKQIRLVYSLRWQIELFFKLCKSEAQVDKWRSRKPNRVQCELYVKLICIVLLLFLVAPIRWQMKFEISLRKAYKQLRQYSLNFFKALSSLKSLQAFIKEFLTSVGTFALKDKYRNKRRATYQKLMDATGQEVLV